MNRYSLIQNERKCMVCETTQNIHIHEVFFGKNRKKSIEDGMCVYLCGLHHNLSNKGVHFNRELDLMLKQTAQRQFEAMYSRAEFLALFGKNYL